MTNLTMREKVARAISESGNHVCVGLDPDPARLPVADVAEFNREIVDSIHDLVAAFKLQFAFYEALGIPGMRALESTVRHIRDVAPDVFIIADAKRGDIANTGDAYARAMFDVWDFDAVTVNPYMGADAITPFLRHAGRGAFVLCWTSNPGATAIQSVRCDYSTPVYRRVAQLAHGQSIHDNVGLVVAPSRDSEGNLTRTDVLLEVSQDFEEMPLLIPGVGAQGGSASDCAHAAGDLFLINSSRGIIYASDDPSGFGRAARRAVEDLRNQIADGLARRGTS